MQQSTLQGTIFNNSIMNATKIASYFSAARDKAIMSNRKTNPTYKLQLLIAQHESILHYIHIIISTSTVR